MKNLIRRLMCRYGRHWWNPRRIFDSGTLGIDGRVCLVCGAIHPDDKATAVGLFEEELEAGTRAEDIWLHPNVWR